MHPPSTTLLRLHNNHEPTPVPQRYTGITPLNGRPKRKRETTARYRDGAAAFSTMTSVIKRLHTTWIGKASLTCRQGTTKAISTLLRRPPPQWTPRRLPSSRRPRSP
ncbi:hypothetical protein XA68_12050 [Ophiocordyceps unilateralis]|uniref:Uncharacterized protein n=1 Tax=Ophiocordyceps unilateralis TaxID=268505 RepID=A0A2A9PDQ9_OPHUN|nr:hypothetical protein XA68_12050 [Ophiocordyceps unilateralis]